MFVALRADACVTADITVGNSLDCDLYIWLIVQYESAVVSASGWQHLVQVVQAFV